MPKTKPLRGLKRRFPDGARLQEICLAGWAFLGQSITTRTNRNSQGSQRSWTQGAKSKKMTERSQITSHPIIDRSINRSINESTSSQVETSNKNRWAKRHMENDLANGKTIKQATRHTIVNRPFKVHYWQKK